MQKKSVKYVLIVFISVLLFPLTYFFVACQAPPSATEKSYVFQEISTYVKNNGDKFSVFDIENYVVKMQNQNMDIGIIYSPKYDTLGLYCDYANLMSALIIQNLNDYSNYTFNIVGYHNLTLMTLLTPQFRIALPATPFKDLQTTTSLPDFQYMDGTIKSKQQTYHANISYAFNTLLSEFDDFYVKSIQGGDKFYTNFTYKIFHLPVLKIEII